MFKMAQPKCNKMFYMAMYIGIFVQGINIVASQQGLIDELEALDAELIR